MQTWTLQQKLQIGIQLSFSYCFSLWDLNPWPHGYDAFALPLCYYHWSGSFIEAGYLNKGTSFELLNFIISYMEHVSLPHHIFPTHWVDGSAILLQFNRHCLFSFKSANFFPITKFLIAKLSERLHFIVLQRNRKLHQNRSWLRFFRRIGSSKLFF